MENELQDIYTIKDIYTITRKMVWPLIQTKQNSDKNITRDKEGHYIIRRIMSQLYSLKAFKANIENYHYSGIF